MCFSVGIERNLSSLAKLFGAKIDGKAFENLALLSEKYPKEFKLPADDNRLYPQVFGPVIVGHQNSDETLSRVIRPMRYRVRPSDAAEEVPTKFNLFNARLDSLESRKTWRPLFGRKHGLFPYKRFYEWVEGDNGKKRLVSFKAKEHELLMAPVLYDYYQAGEKSFYSFAIITTEPPGEVIDTGHDRCPIFIKEDYWDRWLNPSGVKSTELYNILQDPLRPYYHVRYEEDVFVKEGKIKIKEGEPSAQLSLFDKK